MKNLSSYLIFLGLLAVIACDRTEDDFEGGALEDAFGPFAVVEDFSTSGSDFDFEGGETAFFTAQFNKQVNWEVHIMGLESCAHKVISGFSNDINSVNSIWDGSTTFLPMFRIESCAVRADIYDVNDSLLIQYFDTIGVNSLYTPEGLLISDLESGLDPDWGGHTESGMTLAAVDDLKAGQLDQCMEISGPAWGWLIAYVEMEAEDHDETLQYFPLAQSADDVYFNCLINIPEHAAGEKFVLFKFMEDDNGDGIYDSANDDHYTYRYEREGDGWKLLSFSYRDLISVDNGQPTTNGNGVKNPDRIVHFETFVLSDPDAADSYYQVFFDYFSFTKGEPLKP